MKKKIKKNGKKMKQNLKKKINKNLKFFFTCMLQLLRPQPLHWRPTLKSGQPGEGLATSDGERPLCPSRLRTRYGWGWLWACRCVWRLAWRPHPLMHGYL